MTQRDEATILGDMLQGLNEAAACTSGMIHVRPDSKWFFLRDMAEALKAMVVDLVVDPMMSSGRK